MRHVGEGTGPGGGRKAPGDATFGEIAEAVAAIGPSRSGREIRPSAAPTRVDEELIDFLAAGPGPRGVAEFRPSEGTRQRVAELIAREKAGGLAAEETAELDRYLQVEHLMRLAKARARQQHR